MAVPGRAGEWSLAPDWITLNNGSYGACPATVRAAEAAWRARLDRQPTAFVHVQLPALLRAAADRLAGRLGAEAGTVAFTENATAGINAVLRSRGAALQAGDEILLLDQSYGAVRRAAAFVARASGAHVTEATLPFPVCTPADAVAAVGRALTDRTALAVLDHVASPTGWVLPIGDMVAACHARGVPVLVDGAHAPGQVPLDLGAVDADWYAGNLHKWFFASTGTGFLHARRDRQDGLHPTAISHGLDEGFAAEFDWTGTRDHSGWLAAETAMALHDRLGGAALMARNAALVASGAAAVAAALRTEVVPPCLPGGAMALVALPPAAGSTIAAAAELRHRLISARIDVPVSCLRGRLHLRLSAHAYTETADFDRLAQTLTDQQFF